MKNPPFAIGGPDTSQNMIEFLQSSASWARLPGKRKVIWNQLDGSLVPVSNASASVADFQTFAMTEERRRSSSSQVSG